MPGKRKKKYARWRPRRSELGFEREIHNPRPYPFNELDHFQRAFLKALAAPVPAASPRAALRKAWAHEFQLAEWIDQPAFFTGLQVTLRRRFGERRAAEMLTVLFRYLLSQPLGHVCACHGRGGNERKPFFSQED